MIAGADDTTPGHEPVMVSAMLDLLIPEITGHGGTYCDATVGLGGHSRAILERIGPDGRIIGLDRDLTALATSKTVLGPFGDRVRLMHGPFSQVRTHLENIAALPVDGILVDLGVSSPQLDQAERGFSFQRKGPLDMRMDQSQGQTAAEFLNEIGQSELERILRDYGEERFAGRIARHIIEARDDGRLAAGGTLGLASIVAGAVPARDRYKNPATRTFQALRIAVNHELDELDSFLNQAATCLRLGGRLCVISFHSLEDRMVKRRFRAWADPAVAGPRFRVLTKRIVIASEEEQARNPRSRSAKMRAAERVS
jgi:16S rRNA (cytosine1402-N4)-methyltransferase